MRNLVDDAAIAGVSLEDGRWPSQVRLQLAEGVRLEAMESQRWALTHRGQTFSFLLPRAALSAMFTKLAAGLLTMDEVAALVGAEATGRVDRHPLSAREQVTRLWRQGLVRQTLADDGGAIVATLQGGSDAVLKARVRDSEPIAWRGGVCLRREDGVTIVESPESGARIALRDPRLHRAAAVWMEDEQSPEAAARHAGVPAAWTTALGAWLVGADCARAKGTRANGTAAATATVAAGDGEGDGRGYWSFADRLFHARSRMGRHTGEFGGTFRFRDVAPAPPLTGPSRGGRRITLTVPDLAGLAAADRPFTEVFERRRSIREHADEPIALEQLAHFLYRVARVKGRIQSEHYEYTTRPYPSGGSMYELEIYALVNRCEGLAPALYWYDAEAHCLEHVSDPTPETAALAGDAARSSGSAVAPQVLLVVSARFLRVFWKYESMGYALILKNVGVLFGAMYLVATAMGLAPCALGGGNAETFCRAAGTRFWEESSVGEFMLGRPR